MDYIFLTQQFYTDYASCSEIERKPQRPYVQVRVQIGSTIFAVPMRSNINHKYVLWTDESSKCGLDFSKTVVVTKSEYIDRINKPYIRPIEFNALRGKEQLVKEKLLQYIRIYKKAKKRLDVPRNQRICQYSTLQYFDI